MPIQSAFPPPTIGVVTGVTAAGTTQATATPLPVRSGQVEVSTVGSGTSVILPLIRIPSRIILKNAGANALKVYPQVGGTIDGGTVNAAYSLAAGAMVELWASSLTNWYSGELSVGGAAGAGTVTSVSVASANGFAGTVATATSTPAITLSTSVTGILKGDGTGVSAASAGTDYLTGNQTITLSGAVTGSGTTAITTTLATNAVVGSNITNQSVTYAKIQNVTTTSRVLGRRTSGAGSTEECTTTQVLDFISTTQGVVLYRGASTWDALAVGTAGQVLSSGGAGANLSWIDNTSGFTALTGDVTASGSGSQAAKFVGMTNVIAPTITTSQNDWAPTGLSGANVIRVTNATSLLSITGLTGGAEGRIITIQNSGSSTFPVKLTPSDASSSAANRFGVASTIYLSPGESFTLIYHGASSLWRGLSTYRDPLLSLVGTGTDGDATITSPTTLTSDKYYKNLTISGSGAITTAGYRIFVSEVLDLSAAAAGSIVWNGLTAANVNSAGAGAAAAQLSPGTAPGSNSGRNGGAGSTTNGANGVAATTTFAFQNGGQGRIGGAGGAGSGGTGGTQGGASAASVPAVPYVPAPSPVVAGSIQAGYGGAGGGGGGGDTTNSGFGGAGGGSGGGSIVVFSRFLSTGTNTTAGIIQAIGGNGGNGGSPSTGNTGGGGGGAGGSGGWIYECHGYRLGSVITNGMDASSGAGGNGGTKQGTGVNGNGGSSGAGGRITSVNMVTGVVTETSNVASANAASGQTGGTSKTTQQDI